MERYNEEKLRVRVKLTLRILKMSVGIVMVVKLSAQTKIRVTPKIMEPIRYNIQPITPCELVAGGMAVGGEVAAVRTFERLEGRLNSVSFIIASREERVSVAAVLGLGLGLAASVIVGPLTHASERSTRWLGRFS